MEDSNYDQRRFWRSLLRQKYSHDDYDMFFQIVDIKAMTYWDTEKD